jgi:hypothetical protein
LKNAIGQSCSAPSAPAAVVRATAVDAVFGRESETPRPHVSERNRRLAVGEESRSLPRRAVDDAQSSSDATSRTLTATSARRALRKLVADRADELI